MSLMNTAQYTHLLFTDVCVSECVVIWDTVRMDAALQVADLGHHLLVTGRAGTGKSAFLKTAINSLQQRGKKVAVLCPTGVAATHLSEFKATTLHRYRCHAIPLLIVNGNIRRFK